MFTVEKVLRVFNDKEGVFLEVRNNPDFPDSGIQIVTTDKESHEWYGEQCLCLNSSEEAKALAKAILEMAETIK